MKPVPECGSIDAAAFALNIASQYQPVVMRGLVADWPAVEAGIKGNRAMADYISAFDCGRPAEAMVGPPSIMGRFFYADNLRDFNFKRERVPLGFLMSELVRLETMADPPALYAGAAAADEHLPGWLDANPLPLPTPNAKPRIWIGNATNVSTHYDVKSNIACVVAGKRTFTLFPPEQIANLYVGPLEHTIAGQPTSMVNIDAPDYARYPRFADALEHAFVADLEPGDAIFIPPLWWHNVKATGAVNVLVNYWHETHNAPSAFPALAHALLTVRDLPAPERAAWRNWFDHFVFDDAAHHAADHLPVGARGVAGPASTERSDMMIDYLLRALARE